MKCRDCKHKNNVANTEQTGSAICAYPNRWFPVNIEDNCHFIPEIKELTCGDCVRLSEDFACAGCLPEDSAYYDGELCSEFIDKREEELSKLLMFWKVQGLYNREKIEGIIDDFEESYKRLTE